GLSGGERRRLSLAILVAGDANVLILDEPTNHLDLESREALEDALRAFPGSLLLVSHDRALLDAVGSRTVAIEDYTLHSYVGGWPEYWRVREERKAAGVKPAPPLAPLAAKSKGNGNGNGAAPPPQAKPKGPSKNALRRQTELEKAVERTEAELSALEDELADPAAWATKYESAKSTARHTAAKRAVEAAYAALAEHEETAFTE
ncbi:MAG: ATP-binding cassette, subfamily er 3, partial [Solirubrobacteraceae bacterium]|nr:ATP-binding cassette, subfamily er 3 [Solirubrobacteraceae bacterium]